MTAVLNIMFAFLALTPLKFAHSQDAALPKEISGRWTIQGTPRTQTFSIRDISAKPDGNFSATLTWWTFDPKCTLRDEPITGKMTDTGLSFEAKTKCDVSFLAMLERSKNEWAGTARTTSGPEVTLTLKGN